MPENIKGILEEHVPLCVIAACLHRWSGQPDLEYTLYKSYRFTQVKGELCYYNMWDKIIARLVWIDGDKFPMTISDLETKLGHSRSKKARVRRWCWCWCWCVAPCNCNTCSMPPFAQNIKLDAGMNVGKVEDELADEFMIGTAWSSSAKGIFTSIIANSIAAIMVRSARGMGKCFADPTSTHILPGVCACRAPARSTSTGS